MPTTLGLNASRSTILDAAGNGIVQLGPGRYGVFWRLTSATVTASTSVLTPTATLYVGPSSAGNRIGGTYSGQQDSTDLDVTLSAGDTLTAVWVGGDPGATATLSVFGDNTVPSR